jgi:diaminopimelate epimerase
MNIQFWKMHGASNDFVLVDDRTLTFPEKDGKWISSIASRRTGIGSEGIILIQPSTKASFRMRFFNPDGSEVEMCGNGARCVARLAADIGAAPQSMTIETVAGILTAEIKGSLVRLGMTDPKNWALNDALDVAGTRMMCHSVNSGVPHAVTEVQDLALFDVQKYGAALRYHTRFAPAGTNANFIAVTGPDSLRIRTYERGVEAETLACGTGIVASALIAVRLGRVTAPVRVQAASGDILTVGMTTTPDGAKNVTLLGPAEYVFTGTLEYPGSPAGHIK